MTNKLNDGVGKKIVEALKKQSEGDINITDVKQPSTTAVDGLIPNIAETVGQPMEQPAESMDFSDIKTFDSDIFAEEEKEEPIMESIPEPVNEVIQTNSFADINLDNFIDEEPQVSRYTPEINDLEMPANIVILKKLISQLPSGVTRHTGAQIIKQTMEALGISMKSVLKEAQDVQDNLKESAKECQATIQEYKKQIASLEKQSQNYQKQYGALNDLISLFIQTTK